MNPNIPSTDLVQFVRGKNGQRIGVVVARNYNGRVTFGWSAARAPHNDALGFPVRGDEFDKARGLDIAFARTLTGSKVRPPRPVAKVLAEFPARATRYFKGAEIVPIDSGK